jgi:hypothetical protein
MFQNSRLFLSLLILFLTSGSFQTDFTANRILPAQDDPKRLEHNPDVGLLTTSTLEVSYKITVPWKELVKEKVFVKGKEYVRISLPGWSLSEQVGLPNLPVSNDMLGAPFGVNVSVHVKPGPSHIIQLDAPIEPEASKKLLFDPLASTSSQPDLPKVLYEVEENPTVYNGQSEYPQTLAQVSNDGVIRQQRIVSITAYPVQYQPVDQTITIYESLSIEVVFDGKPEVSKQITPSESAAYETLFQKKLKNYEVARQWRLPAAQLSTQSFLEAHGAQNSNALAAHWTPPVPGYRIKVREDGMYKLTFAELQNAGIPVASIDPITFQLFNLGKEIAILVSDDYLVFYGQGIKEKYTEDNIYWLTYGKTAGLRMTTRDGTPANGQIPTSYISTRHFEENIFYNSYNPGDENLERWLWDYTYPPNRPGWTYTFWLTAPEVVTSTLKVAILGYLQNSINPDHHATISLNGTQVGDVWWDGISWQIPELEVPQGVLLAGNNTINITCPNDTGVGNDVVYIDWAEIEYYNTFRAEANELAFRYDIAGTWKYQVDGFNNNQIVVFDVTNPNAVILIENVAVAASALGYSAEFEDQNETFSMYWAMADTTYHSVQAIEADTGSDLGSTKNAADYLLITHKDFWVQASVLANTRDSHMRVIQVDVQDIYDEFGYGITGVTPIHDFIAYAFANWQSPAPSYVVLVGDGHYDPKNYKGYGRTNYIPAYLAPVDPWIGETAADNRYVTVAGDDIFPDLMLGRLSVNSTGEASAFIDKIIVYEQNPSPGDWQKQVLAVADNTDSAGNFAQISDKLLTDHLPQPYQSEKVYYGSTHTTVDSARTAIRTAINVGKLIVNYIGHADNLGWAQEDLLTTSDVQLLTNSNIFPVVLAMTCYDGYYHFPNPITDGQDALGEVITRADGRGAVASWSPTGLGVANGHDTLNRGFFDALFKDRKKTLGEATNAGLLDLWATLSHRELLDTYLLFGDPATRLVVPDINEYLYVPIIQQGYNSP